MIALPGCERRVQPGYAVRGERRQKVSGSAASGGIVDASADKSDVIAAVAGDAGSRSAFAAVAAVASQKPRAALSQGAINLGILATGCDRSSPLRNAFNLVSRSSPGWSPRGQPRSPHVSARCDPLRIVVRSIRAGCKSQFVTVALLQHCGYFSVGRPLRCRPTNWDDFIFH
jgi:hypothetical protein